MAASNISKTTQWKNISMNLRNSLNGRSLKTCILMANVGVPIRMFDNEIILHVFERCLEQPEELQELSMSHLEYLSRVLSLSNFDDKDLVKKVGFSVLNELKNRTDLVAQRGIYVNFTNIVRNLTAINVYDLEILENIFRLDYIKFIHKNSKQLDLQLYEIDGYNRINLKNIYKGNHLADIHLEKLCYLMKWIPDRTKYRKNDEFSYAIEDAVGKYFEYSQYAHAVPHRMHAGKLLTSMNHNSV